jgi:hypothetical protein
MADPQGGSVPFLYAGGRFRNLAGALQGPGPGPASGIANDINNAGQVLGASSAGVFLYDGGRARIIDLHGVSPRGFMKINGDGVVAGVGRVDGDPSVEWRPFLYDAGRTRVLSPLPTSTLSLSLTDFNNAGQMALFAAGNDSGVGYVRDDGRYQRVPGLSFQPGTVLAGLNEQGWGVGSSVDFIPGYGTRTAAFLWRGGKESVNLNELVRAQDAQHWYLRDAMDINDRGQIVGTGAVAGSPYQHLFLATPVPEPSTWALWLAGVAFIGGAVRRPTAGA